MSNVAFECVVIGLLWSIGEKIGVPRWGLLGPVIFGFVVLALQSAHANPLDTTPEVQRWFHQNAHPTRAQIEQMATHDFQKCLVLMKDDPDAMLRCATQVLDSWQVPRANPWRPQ
jgi:hypothetical protein